MIVIVLLSVLLGLCLLVWAVRRIIRQIRSRERLDLVYCLACGVGLAGIDAILCLTLQIMAGLSHSEAAKFRADVECLASSLVLVVLPTVGLLVYRHVQAMPREAATKAGECAVSRTRQRVLAEARTDGTAVRRPTIVGVAALICAIVVALAPVALIAPGHLLTYAVRCGNTNLATLLVDAGVDVDRPDDHAMTPLMHAARNGDTTMVRVLLDRGANANFARGGIPPLFFGIESCRGEVVALLVERGADFEYQERYGNRPLVYAAQYGSVEVVQALLNRGADINNRDDLGRTALMRAALCNRLEVVAALLDSGADTGLRDKKGRTALGLRWSGLGPPPNDPIVQLLIRYGAGQ